MGRKPNVGLGPSVKNPNVSKPPTGPVGSVIGGVIPSLPGRGGFVDPGPLPYPEIGRPVFPPENKGPVGSIIGDIGDGRIPLPIVRPPTQPIEETRPGDDGSDPRPPRGPVGSIIGGIIDGGSRPTPRSRLDRKQIDKSPEARQKFLDSLTREELEQRSHQDPVRGSRVKPVQENSSRVQPVQDRRTRDFNPNLESFDAKQYLANYGDLQKAFGTDEAKARQHFIDYGMKEGRVDTAGGGTLKTENRDRRAKTFKARSKAAAAKRREGFLKGEEGATFDAKQYLANYADLQKAFGSDEEKARQHYRQYGAKEGRVDTKM